MDYRFDCRDFNGYKPCRPGWTCDDCREYRTQGYRILIINMDALGDVLMTTALLPVIKKTHPVSTIRWITSPGAVPLLENNPYIDEIIPYSTDAVSFLRFMDFDLVLSCDRDRKSTALAMSTPALRKRGFSLGPHGNITYFNPEFEYAYRLGLDDDLKFKRNLRTGQQILAEGMGFAYDRADYVLKFTPGELDHICQYRRDLGLTESLMVLGINTGCSGKFPYKKLPFDHTVTVISQLLDHPESDNLRILLLGGKTETDLNRNLANIIDDSRIIQTPTTEGIRRGLHYITACDVCLTGDTFGLHAAIACKVPVVTYFTISCDVEIDLYDRGEKVLADVPCRPCWKSYCPEPICIDRIDPDALTEAVWRVLRQFRNWRERSS
ncbi:glycosyltransferase family 9 protein [bacterium]|nr:glycosyltransferase family 9 protein [candidate division CSSED10-310 bacterium]